MTDTNKFKERRAEMKFGLPVSAWVGFITAALSIGVSWGVLNEKLAAEVEARKTANHVLEENISEIKVMIQDMYKVIMHQQWQREGK